MTCLGTTFAGRVAGSLRHAIELPELIAATPDEYEALATAIDDKLARQRAACPLFDADRFRRHL